MSENSEIEKIILSFSKKDWLKTAMILAETLRECDARYEEIAAKLGKLCDLKQLESRGDLTKWRHSEVRLPQTQA
jgi:hypothetical protein